MRSGSNKLRHSGGEPELLWKEGRVFSQGQLGCEASSAGGALQSAGKHPVRES